MIRYRSFLNCDPPALLRVWREQPVSRGLMQPISNILLEMFVLSKPYFDRHGLIVAHDAGQVVGFVHAGFGPDLARTALANQVGITCVLAVVAHQQRPEILRNLLAQSEAYLRERGAKELQIGGRFPVSPFYLGLSGGSDLSGVLSTDTEMDSLYRELGYVESHRCVVLERQLNRYRPPVDRRIIEHRRNYRLIPQVNPANSPWWDACVLGPTDRIRFQLQAKRGGSPCGEITFWDMGPLSTRPNGGGMGMIDFAIEAPHRGLGLGTFLASESLKHLQTSGINRIEAQTMLDNLVTIKLLTNLGFAQTRTGIFYRKSL